MITTMQEPLSALNLFPTHPTRAAYKAATGSDAPLFDHTQPPKYWADAAALQSDLPEVVYARVPMKGPNDGYIVRQGAPVFKPLVLTKAIAAAVNIPDESDIIIDATQDQDWIKPPIPCPMRELEPGEQYAPDPIAGVIVRNMALYVQQLEKADTFIASDRVALAEIKALLVRIASKVGA